MEALLKIQQIEDLRKELNDRVDYLGKQQSIYDKKVADINHALELCSLNAVQFTKLSYKLREILGERRIIKNELYILGAYRASKKFSDIMKDFNERETRIKKEAIAGLSKII